MALTHQMNVTANGIKQALPDGYTAPTVSLSLSDNAIELPLTNYKIAASGNVAGADSANLTSLVSALKTAIETKLGDGAGNLGLDESTNTIEAISTITSMKRQSYDPNDGDTALSTGGDEFVFTVQTSYEITA